MYNKKINVSIKLFVFSCAHKPISILLESISHSFHAVSFRWVFICLSEEKMHIFMVVKIGQNIQILIYISWIIWRMIDSI